MSQPDERRVPFKFEIDFTNGGGIQGQGFRLDIDGEDITDQELSQLPLDRLASSTHAPGRGEVDGPPTGMGTVQGTLWRHQRRGGVVVGEVGIRHGTA